MSRSSYGRPVSRRWGGAEPGKIAGLLPKPLSRAAQLEAAIRSALTYLSQPIIDIEIVKDVLEASIKAPEVH